MYYYHAYWRSNPKKPTESMSWQAVRGSEPKVGRWPFGMKELQMCQNSLRSSHIKTQNHARPCCLKAAKRCTKMTDLLPTWFAGTSLLGLALSFCADVLFRHLASIWTSKCWAEVLSFQRFNPEKLLVDHEKVAEINRHKLNTCNLLLPCNYEVFKGDHPRAEVRNTWLGTKLSRLQG